MKPEFDAQPKRVAPPFECKAPIVLTLIKDGVEREVTIPAERADQYMPQPFPMIPALFSGGGGRIRIIRQC